MKNLIYSKGEIPVGTQDRAPMRVPLRNITGIPQVDGPIHEYYPEVNQLSETGLKTFTETLEYFVFEHPLNHFSPHHEKLEIHQALNHPEVKDFLHGIKLLAIHENLHNLHDLHDYFKKEIANFNPLQVCKFD